MRCRVFAAVLLWGVAFSSPGGAAFAEPQSPQSWAQFHFDSAHTGFNPSETVLSPQTVPGLRPIWIRRRFYTAIEASPAVAGGRVFVSATGASDIFAMDERTGASLWADRASDSSPALADGLVMFGATRTFRANQAATGTQVWANAPPGGTGGSPVVAHGRVVSGEEGLEAVDVATGTKLWATARFPATVHFAPAVDQGTVFVSLGELAAFRASSGTLLWTVAGNFLSSPSASEGTVYVGDDDNLQAFSEADGSPVWTAAVSAGKSTPAIADGVLYVGAEDGTLHAIDQGTGASIWTDDLGGAIESSPAVANGVVYVGSTTGALYAVDAETGTTLWSGTTNASIGASSPAVVDGHVFIGDEDGYVYCFGL